MGTKESMMVPYYKYDQGDLVRAGKFSIRKAKHVASTSPLGFRYVKVVRTAYSGKMLFSFVYRGNKNVYWIFVPAEEEAGILSLLNIGEEDHTSSDSTADYFEYIL